MRRGVIELFLFIVALVWIVWSIQRLHDLRGMYAEKLHWLREGTVVHVDTGDTGDSLYTRWRQGSGER